MISRDDVVNGYRLILGREPDQAAFDAHMKSESIDAFRITLLGSPEFRVKVTRFLGDIVIPGFEAKDLSIFDTFLSGVRLPAPGFITDFHGSRTDINFLWDGVSHLSGKVLPKPISGDYRGDVLEWLGLFKSVRAGKPAGQFSMMELGAGFGPWLIAGAVAARNIEIADIHLVGVEGDPGRYSLMLQHFRNNGFDPADHHLVQAGVGAESGKARWPRISDIRHASGLVQAEADADTFRNVRGFDGDLIDIDIVSFRGLLERRSLWDLIHIDVQGSELEICASAPDLLKQSVRYMIVGTHSRLLDAQMMELMFSLGFVLEHERPTKFRFNSGARSLREMTYVDGTQVWRNPTL